MLESSKKSIFLVGVLLISSVWLILQSFPLERPQLRVVACDVGQGDAILVLYDGVVILIDVGPNSAILECLRENLPFGRLEIDLLVLTHSDKDHIGGFSDVVKTYKVKQLFSNPKDKDTDAGRLVKQWALEHPRNLSPLGGEIFFAPGLRLQVVWSESVREALFADSKNSENFNSDSIGLWIGTASFGFLSLGDLECREELAVTHMGLLGKVRLLKMSHHGAKTSSCLEFLEKIHPEVAFYSSQAGNSYGHPHIETLKNAEKAGVFVLGTPEGGELSFKESPHGVHVQTEKAFSLGSRLVK